MTNRPTDPTYQHHNPTTANARRAKLQLTPEGIPPIVNLRGLLQCLAWCLRDGLVAWGGGSPQQPADGMCRELVSAMVVVIGSI